MNLRSLVTAFCGLISAGAVLSADSAPPASAFDLKNWKLQIPGPNEVKSLAGYASSYFHLNKEHAMCFVLDAAEKGATPNTKYVRSELRHLLVWKADQAHSMSAEVRVSSHLEPDKVTVLQIHGITAEGGDAPPLLRIAVNEGHLLAFIKKDNSGEETEKIPLKQAVGAGWFKVGISVDSGRLKIIVDNQQKADRDISWWKFPNYFKAGCYPQATRGTAEVMIRRLTAQ